MKTLFLALPLLLSASAVVAAETPSPQRPNVLVVITDDQGFGEFSCHGNPVVQTPHLDRLHDESIRLADFHVAPMCTPTRGQLMTGVDSLRNGAMNVSSGRTLLRRSFPTMGDLFTASGWQTGLFGKWHLGDTYRYRPQDRGFQESVWFPSSHIGSVPDAWQNDYFGDTYVHNGVRQTYRGYTTDVLFRESMQWMKTQADAQRPFFCYLATAAAHQPHYVPQRNHEAAKKAFEAVRDSLPSVPPEKESELIRFLGMVDNIDENMGRLEAFLTESGLRENTVVIFLTDNGSTFGPKYFNANMRGGKMTLWEGGHRVPCFIRWPAGTLRPAGDIKGLTQVQDVLPTLVDLLGMNIPTETKFDGISLAPVLKGTQAVPEDRMMVINYSRMPFKTVQTTPNNPAVPRREGAVVLWKQWRLLSDKQLYNLADDPLQTQNVIAEHPEVTRAMRAHLNAWWDGVKDQANKFERSIIGHDAENPVQLTACEWADVFVDQQKQVRAGDRKNGVWHIEVAKAGEYEFRLSRWPDDCHLHLASGVDETRVTDGVLQAGPAWPVAEAQLRVGKVQHRAAVASDAGEVRFRMNLPAGPTTMQSWFYDGDGKEIAGAYYVAAERLPKTEPVKLILDTDMSGDADDVGTLAMLHALADRGECELLATIVNRADLTKASAAAVDAINTYYGRPNLPIGTDKVGPTALQRTSSYAASLRDGFPNDIGPDDKAPDALDVYRKTLSAQPDNSVTICSVGALSNLAELWRREPELVKSKVRRLVIMGGEFPQSNRPETNIKTHLEASIVVANEWPGEIVWQGFEIGNTLITGERLKQTPHDNPVRRGYEKRRYKNRASIDGGQPSYDQAAALFAVRGAQPQYWEVVSGGRVKLDANGVSTWVDDPTGKHHYVKRVCPENQLATVIESLMVTPPKRLIPGDTK
ncbi:sulfatase-like hydrolase/transferase [Novipirellula caenicola]